MRNQYLNCRRLKWSKEFQILKFKPCTERLFLAARNCGSMDNAEYGGVDDEKEENPPLSVESEMYYKPRRIALFVEPSPFSYISGYNNRFQNFIKYLCEMGDEVMVVTTREGVPHEFCGAKLIGSRSPRIISAVAQFKPDIIHVSSPGIMVFGALIIAKLLSVPIVVSHSCSCIYSEIYLQLASQTNVVNIEAADLTLVPSAAIAKDLEAARVTADTPME